ncbi:hypothetical protein HGG82_06200 [Marinomonas sp. M1K-6]|uniref:Uncharacterized protein n=1 Tax=Marinomonas profundi TaxID=2726122 RepID=A0A847R7V4_9GAMM|nr:hypothetical protein [Marinomonas profundi]NLQ17217.1 hypothetical protein [Marinomonas profundi]UDV04592.1 hypothetical protein J8N69_07570 [Marinomonas profundi]
MDQYIAFLPLYDGQKTRQQTLSALILLTSEKMLHYFKHFRYSSFFAEKVQKISIRLFVVTILSLTTPQKSNSIGVCDDLSEESSTYPKQQE